MVNGIVYIDPYAMMHKGSVGITFLTEGIKGRKKYFYFLMSYSRNI